MQQPSDHSALSTSSAPSAVHRASAPASAPSAEGSALAVEHLLNLLRASRKWIEEGGSISGYGFYRPENPHNFSPDVESCSDEELANHKAACDAWDRGDYKAPLGSESFHDADGKLVLHITRAPWGIGSYTDMADEAADLLAAIDCSLHAAQAASSPAASGAFPSDAPTVNPGSEGSEPNGQEPSSDSSQ